MRRRNALAGPPPIWAIWRRPHPAAEALVHAIHVALSPTPLPRWVGVRGDDLCATAHWVPVNRTCCHFPHALVHPLTSDSRCGRRSRSGANTRAKEGLTTLAAIWDEPRLRSRQHWPATGGRSRRERTGHAALRGTLHGHFGRRWGGYLSIVLLIGLTGGIAMGSIAAARRTQASYATFLASTNPSDMNLS